MAHFVHKITKNGLLLRILATAQDFWAKSGNPKNVDFGPLLFPMLENVHPAVREASVRSLSRLEKENSLIGLRNMLADADPDVVSATTAGLSNIETS